MAWNFVPFHYSLTFWVEKWFQTPGRLVGDT